MTLNRAQAGFKLRKITNIEEIIKLFTEMMLQKVPLNITQKGSTQIIDGIGSVVSVETINRFVIEVAVRDNKLIELDPFKPLSIYSIHRNVYFETNFKYNKIRNVLFSIPTSIERMETRKEPRFLFKKGEDNMARLELILSQGPDRKQLELQRPLFDISKSGLAILVTEQEMSFFHPGETCHVDEGPAGVKDKDVRILYVKQVRDVYSNKLAYRVGCRIDEEAA